jgi:hypothetical protein
VFPLHAVKTDNYKCPVCENDIIFKSGKINRKHYSHKAKSNCSYYNSPSESEIHKDGKRLMKKMLDDKEKLMIWRNCKCCGDDIEVLSLINYTDKMECREEFAFQHNSNKRIADVVLLDDDNINFIFEIFKTHRTDEINRPTDKWCEINAEDLIINTMEERNRNDAGEIEIECVRDIICCECENKHKIKLEEKNKKKNYWELMEEENERRLKWAEQEVVRIKKSEYDLVNECGGGGDEITIRLCAEWEIAKKEDKKRLEIDEGETRVERISKQCDAEKMRILIALREREEQKQSAIFKLNSKKNREKRILHLQRFDFCGRKKRII